MSDPIETSAGKPNVLKIIGIALLVIIGLSFANGFIRGLPGEGAPPPVAVPTLTVEQLQAQAVTLSYDDLARNTEHHEGKLLALAGDVGVAALQVHQIRRFVAQLHARGLSGRSLGRMLSAWRGYFGWLGAFIVGAGDTIARPATDQPSNPTPDYWKTVTGGMAADLRDAPSRYVSQMYDQAKEIEKAYGTWKMLVREGKVEEAREFRADNAELLNEHKQVERVKKAESALNQRARMIERSNMDPDRKRELLRQINEQKDRTARLAS